MTDRYRILWSAGVASGVYFGAGLIMMIFTFSQAKQLDLRERKLAR